MSASVGVAGSILLHLAALGSIGAFAASPELGFELRLPAEVEFGLTDSAEMGAPASPPPPSAAAPEPEPEEDGEDEEGIGLDGGTPKPDAGAGAADAGPRVAAADGGPGDAGRLAQASADAGGLEGEGSGKLPPGAQLAARIDMRAIRGSSLAPKVRSLLEVMPDWQRLLEGSGIEPVDDLERVLIAHPGKTKPNSPWLDPSVTIVAGEHRHDERFVRQAVAAMADARGEQAEWTTRLGVPVAPWHDRSGTERIVALIGARQFAVTRPQDLAPLLAVAKERAEQQADGGAAANAQAWAEALLSMDEGAALSFEVEGARRFVVGMQQRLPSKLRMSVRELDDGRIGIEGHGRFDDAEQADTARAFWNRQREHYAANPWVGLVNMDDPLREARLETEDGRLEFATTVTPAQIRLALGFVEDFFRKHGRPPMPPRPAPDPSP